jgi:hypothetical protein
MKYLITTLAALFILISCKKEKTDGEGQLYARMLQPGWTITEIDYSGFAPNPLDTTKLVPFTGQGVNVSGFFLFEEDPKEGEFEIKFTSTMDLGLSQPISFPVTEKHRGFYEVRADESHVKMWRNDTIFDWKVEVNQEKRQTWSTSFMYKLVLTPTNSINVPISVKATMVR